MCDKCKLSITEVERIWERLIERLGVAEETRQYSARWVDLCRSEFVYAVWNGRPQVWKLNLLCAALPKADTYPTPKTDLVPCDKIREMLDSPLDFDEALQVYLYTKAIRSL